MTQILIKWSYLLLKHQPIVNVLVAVLKLYQFLKYALVLHRIQQLVHLVVPSKIFLILLIHKLLVDESQLTHNFLLNSCWRESDVKDILRLKKGNFCLLLRQWGFNTIVFHQVKQDDLRINVELNEPIIELNPQHCQ